MALTKVSIRWAIKKIAEITCGVRPKAISVTVAGDPMHPTFWVSIPFEYKVEVSSYLAQHLGLRHKVDGKPLSLTSSEAAAIVDLVLKHGMQCQEESTPDTSCAQTDVAPLE